MKYINRILGVLLLLPFFAGCNDTDDVTEIFIKNWKLTYITKANDHGWYQFPGIERSNYEAYIRGDKIFTLSFSGNETDNVINGPFTGAGSVNVNGTWSANGKNQHFKIIIKEGKPTDNKDKIAGKILEGLEKANSYKGSDSRNLYLYYQTEQKENLCLVFAPSRN